MLEIVTGNIFDSGCQTLACPVNCVGVMGKGLALEFKTRYPLMFKRYRVLCVQGEFRPGHLWLAKQQTPWILCFPTKDDWRNPSQVTWIESGLLKLSKQWQSRGITSIAIPPLGCGLGGLDFDLDVRPLVEQYLDHKTLLVKLYRK